MHEQLGGLPVLSWIWEVPFGWSIIVAILADFGGVCFWMITEGRPPWERGLFRAFLWNDLVFIPIIIGAATVVVQRSAEIKGFYISPVWGVFVLGLSYTFVIWMEVASVKVGWFTVSQSLSPSKLYHTLIFGVMAYWLVNSLVIVAKVHQPVWAVALVVLAILGFIATNVYDTFRPQDRPIDAHLEGTYIPWNWHERIKREE